MIIIKPRTEIISRLYNPICTAVDVLKISNGDDNQLARENIIKYLTSNGIIHNKPDQKGTFYDLILLFNSLSKRRK